VHPGSSPFLIVAVMQIVMAILLTWRYHRTGRIAFVWLGLLNALWTPLSFGLGFSVIFLRHFISPAIALPILRNVPAAGVCLLAVSFVCLILFGRVRQSV
jgi:hypothetical protein